MIALKALYEFRLALGNTEEVPIVALAIRGYLADLSQSFVPDVEQSVTGSGQGILNPPKRGFVTSLHQYCRRRLLQNRPHSVQDLPLSSLHVYFHKADSPLPFAYRVHRSHGNSGEIAFDSSRAVGPEP